MRPTIRLTILLLFLFSGCGSEAEAPPVSIPAPVPENVEVSAPDVATGLVTVTGLPGAVTGGNTVQVTNLTAAQGTIFQKIENLFLRSALASETTVETTALDDGSFTLQIAASVEDTLRIISIDPESGNQSDPLDVTVPAT